MQIGRNVMSHTGECLCGNISYKLEGEAMFSVVCHCKNCQTQSGSAFSINLICSQDQIKITGELSSYEDRSDEGNQVFRKFCGNCGSPILSELTAYPGLIALKAGTLHDTASVKPNSQVWCDSGQDWLKIDGVTPRFAKNRTG